MSLTFTLDIKTQTNSLQEFQVAELTKSTLDRTLTIAYKLLISMILSQSYESKM